jgi:hypothetical protein
MEKGVGVNVSNICTASAKRFASERIATGSFKRYRNPQLIKICWIKGHSVNVNVELDAYVLPADHKIYKFFPGKDYKFYDTIRSKGVAIIDVRGLDELDGRPGKWNEELVLECIARDRVNRQVSEGRPRPTRIVRSVGDKATHTFLDALFYKASQGDLLLMPAKGYTTEVMIGRFATRSGTLSSIDIKDGDGESHRYYGRRINWIGSVEKRLLTDELITLLHSQAAFFAIYDLLHEQIYRRVYDNYVRDGYYIGTFRTSKNIFTPKDSFLTSVWLELLDVLESARTTGTRLATGESIYELVIASDIDQDSRDDLSISVQSPGWFRIRSLVAAPFASLAVFALAVQGVPYDQAVAATVSATMVRAVNDACMGDVDASVRDYITLLGRERWEQACKLAVQAQTEAKLNAKAQVVTEAENAAKKGGD